MGAATSGAFDENAANEAVDTDNEVAETEALPQPAAAASTAAAAAAAAVGGAAAAPNSGNKDKGQQRALLHAYLSTIRSPFLASRLTRESVFKFNSLNSNSSGHRRARHPHARLQLQVSLGLTN